jgi:hypothetical protein
MKMTLKDLVKGTMADFVCYRDGDLWYRITGQQTPNSGQTEPFTFEFPVPIVDTGTGVFPAQIKSITLMRWVRKHFDKVQQGDWNA